MPFIQSPKCKYYRFKFVFRCKINEYFTRNILNYFNAISDFFFALLKFVFQCITSVFKICFEEYKYLYIMTYSKNTTA